MGIKVWQYRSGRPTREAWKLVLTWKHVLNSVGKISSDCWASTQRAMHGFPAQPFQRFTNQFNLLVSWHPFELCRKRSPDGYLVQGRRGDGCRGLQVNMKKRGRWWKVEEGWNLKNYEVACWEMHRAPDPSINTLAFPRISAASFYHLVPAPTRTILNSSQVDSGYK